MRFLISILVITLFTQVVIAERQSITVAPQTTDPNISTNLSDHFVSINQGVTPKNQLFVFFPGTGGRATNQLEINRTAADLGFHAINLNYVNDDAINMLCAPPNINLDCYGNIRLEVLDGTDRSSLVNVNRSNSIENRLIKLLIYLNTTRPTENWNQFLNSNSTVNWSKIVISGHSQGGGFAGIIGRYHPVVRVVMFAAMDFNGLAGSPANWIEFPSSTPNATPPERFWGFSHQRDESVNFNLLRNRVWTAYGMTNFGNVVNVDSTSQPYNNTHSLTSNIECTNFHGCVAVDASLVQQNGVPVYKPVWEYLLSGTTPSLTLNSIEFLRSTGQLVGRPTVGMTTKLFKIRVSGGGFDATSKVLVNGLEMETDFINSNEITAKLPAGKIRSVGSTTVQVRNQGNQTSTVLSF